MTATISRAGGRVARMATTLLAAAISATLIAPTAAAAPAISTSPATAVTSPLVNLAHLDSLIARVSVPDTAAHSTYRLRQEPRVGVLWVYAESQPNGSFVNVGGGDYDATANTYGQGAYDADDIARAAVVYLRQWRAAGDEKAKDQAYQLLRGLTYLQTLTGPKAGEVVLWMQPDGRLNPSATPAENPDPSDSDASYWLARTLWALGEGYAAFRASDPDFAAFLKARMDLAVSALGRDVLTRYGTEQIIHGVRVPDWLIVDGADASSEAVLGLAAYVRAGGDPSAGIALRQLAQGISAMSAGTTTAWPYRALLPWALSRSDWHAWGANMPAALAAAAQALGEKSLLATAVDDTAGFTAQLLTSTGPDNEWLPAPTDSSQIAYGADARVQGLLAVGAATNRPGIRQLAGIAAGWFFGQNAAGVPVYDPSSGVTRDGIAGDGKVNLNSGAESTIHGLLTMQVLDANPDLAALATAAASIRGRDGLTVLEAESGSLSGDSTIVTPPSAWTGESKFSGGTYVAAGPGSTIRWALPAGIQPRLVQPVVELAPGSSARSIVLAGHSMLGTVRFGAVGRQGQAPSPTELLPIALPHTVDPTARTVTLRTTGGKGNVDALLVMPEVATLSAEGSGHAVALLTSKSGSTELRAVSLGGSGRGVACAYDRSGRLLSRSATTGSHPTVSVAPGGFTVLTR